MNDDETRSGSDPAVRPKPFETWHTISARIREGLARGTNEGGPALPPEPETASNVTQPAAAEPEESSSPSRESSSSGPTD